MALTPVVAPSPARVLLARNAVAVSFTLNGFAFASWASRVPEVKARLALDNSQLGLLLLGLSIGSLTALPAAGRLVERFSTAGVVRIGTVLNVLGLVLVSLGVGVLQDVPVTALALFSYGMGTGVWDVAMNVEAADVERRMGRTVMPRFHAAFSGGTVLGAGLGAVVVAGSVDLPVHLLAVAALVGVSSLVSLRWFLPVATATEGEVPVDPEAASPRGRSAWLEPRTLLIGMMVLALALTEGTANDWLAVALEEGYDVARWQAVLGFAGFVTAMTVGRLVGPVLLDRHGRAPALWGTMAAAAVGVVMLALGETPWLVVPGILLWGFGASLGFPVGMSAAADDPARAAARVAVVSTIGYTAFLAGPPLLGFLGDQVGALHSLLLVSVLLVPAALVVPAARAPRSPDGLSTSGSRGGT